MAGRIWLHRLCLLQVTLFASFAAAGDRAEVRYSHLEKSWAHVNPGSAHLVNVSHLPSIDHVTELFYSGGIRSELSGSAVAISDKAPLPEDATVVASAVPTAPVLKKKRSAAQTLTESEPAGLHDMTPLEEASALSFHSGLPLGGTFYGQAFAGWRTANATIALESARRFMAERTGSVVAVRHNNRTLSETNIEGRCEANGTDSVWCGCFDSGLDAYTCGYTLSNSYSVGNGGLISIELRADDGSPEHRPSDMVLARTVNPYIPLDIASNTYPEFEFDKPPVLQAGKLYHLVYKNLNPPTSCALRAVEPDDALKCPRDQGAIGLNGVAYSPSRGPTGRFGPYLSDAPAIFTRQSVDGQWMQDENNVSWYELQYGDGVWVGDSSVAYDAMTSGMHIVEGSTKGRQVFTVAEKMRPLTGMWLNHGYLSTADEVSMSVQLQYVDGNGIVDGKLEVSGECRVMVKSASNKSEENCREWGFFRFPKSVQLRQGESYQVILSAPAGAGYAISTYSSLAHYGSTDRNHWADAHAEISTDNGENWVPWSSNFSGRDIPMLFTVEGQPELIR